ncbi:hypothetical protein TNCV_3062041 [Trichonephila clavipes]|nr:hypothetical protein TNCV_3062041 [Trichonephila clavipes]
MDHSLLTFRILYFSPIGTGTRGGPKLRWADYVEDEFKVARGTNRRTVAKRRSENGRGFLRSFQPAQGYCVKMKSVFVHCLTSPSFCGCGFLSFLPNLCYQHKISFPSDAYVFLTKLPVPE